MNGWGWICWYCDWDGLLLGDCLGGGVTRKSRECWSLRWDCFENCIDRRSRVTNETNATACIVYTILRIYLMNCSPAYSSTTMITTIHPAFTTLAGSHQQIRESGILVRISQTDYYSTTRPRGNCSLLKHHLRNNRKLPSYDISINKRGDAQPMHSPRSRVQAPTLKQDR